MIFYNKYNCSLRRFELISKGKIELVSRVWLPKKWLKVGHEKLTREYNLLLNEDEVERIIEENINKLEMYIRLKHFYPNLLDAIVVGNYTGISKETIELYEEEFGEFIPTEAVERIQKAQKKETSKYLTLYTEKEEVEFNFTRFIVGLESIVGKIDKDKTYLYELPELVNQMKELVKIKSNGTE